MKVDKTKWGKKTLGEVCKLYQPQTIATNSLQPTGKYLVYGANGVIGRYNAYNHESPEVLITCRGATCGTINISKPFSWINGNAMVVHPKEENVFDFTFLGRVVSAIDYSKVITGAAQPQITVTNLRKILISIPPLCDQQIIVAELNSIQTMIDGYNALLEDLDALAQSIFMEMFGDPLDNPKGLKKDLLENIVHSKCAISYGIVQPGEDEENGIPVIRPVDLTSTYVSLKGLKKVSPSISNNYRRTILRGDEILLCVRGTTGIVSLATEELKGCNVTRGIVPLYFDSQNRWFIYYCFKSSGINNEIQKHTKGATLKQINIGELRRISFPIPPLHLQQQFAKQVEAIEKQKDLLRVQLKDAETLMAERMQYYFS